MAGDAPWLIAVLAFPLSLLFIAAIFPALYRPYVKTVTFAVVAYCLYILARDVGKMAKRMANLLRPPSEWSGWLKKTFGRNFWSLLLALFLDFCRCLGEWIPRLLKTGASWSVKLARLLFVRDGPRVNLSLVTPRVPTPRRGPRFPQDQPASVMPGTYPAESSDESSQLAEGDSWTMPACSQSDAALPREAPVSEQQSALALIRQALPATFGSAPAKPLILGGVRRLKGILKIRTYNQESKALEQTGAITEVKEKKVRIAEEFAPIIGTPLANGMGSLNPAAYGRAIREGKVEPPSYLIQETPVRKPSGEPRRNPLARAISHISNSPRGRALAATKRKWVDPLLQAPHIPYVPTLRHWIKPILTPVKHHLAEDLEKIFGPMIAQAKADRQVAQERAAFLAGLQTPDWLREHAPQVQQLFRDADMVNNFPFWFPLLDAGDREHFLGLKQQMKDMSAAAQFASRAVVEKELAKEVWWSSLEKSDKETLVLHGADGADLTEHIKIAARSHWEQELAQQAWWVSVTEADREQFIKRLCDGEDVSAAAAQAERAHNEAERARAEAAAKAEREAANKAKRAKVEAHWAEYRFWKSITDDEREQFITRTMNGEDCTKAKDQALFNFWKARYMAIDWYQRLRPSDQDHMVRLRLARKDDDLKACRDMAMAAWKMKTFDRDGFLTLGPSRKPAPKPAPEPGKKEELPPGTGRSSTGKCMPKGGNKGGVIGFTMG